MNKVISIIILDYKIEKTREIEGISTKWRIKEVTSGKNIELTDDLELYIIEIPKVKRILDKNSKDELAQWITFLDNPNKLGEMKIMENNKDLKKAMEELENISQDKRLRIMAEMKEKSIRDELSKKNYMEHLEREVREGQKELEEGQKELEEGKMKLKKEQKELSEEKNKLKNEKQDMIKKLLKLEMPIEQISEITGLTKEDIMKIKTK